VVDPGVPNGRAEWVWKSGREKLFVRPVKTMKSATKLYA